jgi:DNA (cytosine-5)-methyltransferase 1
MGEQVARQAGYGWLDRVRADLAQENYASRGVDIPALAVDAPHHRQRLYWVAGNMGNTNDKGSERCNGPLNMELQGTTQQIRPVGQTSFSCSTNNDNGFWSDHVWLAGSDGKSRRSKSGLLPLAHGVSNRVGRLRAYGNAIVPPLAAEVIRAFMET